VLYVKFDGGTISRDDVKRWAGTDWKPAVLDAKGDGITVTPFLAGRTDREQVIALAMQKLRNRFEAFNVDVQRITGPVVEGQQATTLFIGPATIDGYKADQVNMASDVDFGNDNATDVGFVGQVVGTTDDEIARWVANVPAHEAGHTFGLAHVNNQGLNEHMRVGGLSSGPETARNAFTFLDKDLTVGQWEGGKFVPTKDAEGNNILQNSYKTLRANLGLAPALAKGPQGEALPATNFTVGDPDGSGGCGCPLCRGAAFRAEAAPQAVAAPEALSEAGKAVPSGDVSSGILALRENRACVLVVSPANASLPSAPHDTLIRSAVGGEQLVMVYASGGEQLGTADGRADLLTGSPARGQDATSFDLAQDRAMALSDELFAEMVRKPQRPPR
jgi:hypothetical protein